MYEQNHLEVGRALNHVLRPMLAAFVAQNLERHFANKNWWQWGVLDFLYEGQKRSLPHDGSYAELTDKLDVQLCLFLIDVHWDKIFSRKMPRLALNWIRELKTVRNAWAHDVESFDDVATVRALDTMALVAESFDEEAAGELRAMKNARFKREEPQQEILPIPSNLKSWRDVIEPHPDVAQGSYLQAEFALNLAEIIRNDNGRAEYTEPVEFFTRTYLTDGLKKLLVETLRRLADGRGEPIIQLKTSFGGGKSHSLLALYHLFGGIRPEQSSTVREVLDAAGVKFIPKVSTAVIVGTWENPLRSTLWGELAAQLSRATGKPELYEMIRENDERGVSPGAALLKKLFDEAGACLVLIDELVAYGRKLKIGEISDGGTVGNLMSFIQELTEAAKASARTAVIVSIPESDAEVVDENGRIVRAQVEKVFGRMEFVWTPVSVTEGYEIVRRRLFKNCHDEQAREDVCAAFFGMYVNNAGDFPYESRQKNYRERLLSCYPIHPKLFDYFYEKWTSLDGFQKTRGALRVMAKVIYELWTGNDKSLLIMPSTIPLYADTVRDELTKMLSGNWDAIVNGEVDGERSKPTELDAQNLRYGRLNAARKIARTIFMGTAPGSRKGDVRGVEENEIRLATVQPHEIEHIAVYNDALTKLKANLYYLYSQGSRLWFGVNPTLRKFVDDKREQFSDDDVVYEIEQRLKRWRERGAFKAVHICPKTSEDVPDEQAARLVILSPEHAYGLQQKNAAIETARTILDMRGTVPRRWRNMLLFMAADAEKLRVLKDIVRDFMAWREVGASTRSLNLDSLQIDDAKSNLKLSEENFAMKLSQAYCKIFVPERSGDGDLNRPMEVADIDCTKEDNISAASEKFIYDDNLIGSLGPDNLTAQMNKFLWRDDDAVEFKRLWEYFSEFYYLPRLIDVNVLINAVRRGVSEKKFALAKKSDDGNFFDVEYGAANVQISSASFVLKASVAEKILNITVEPPPEKIQPEPPERKPPTPQPPKVKPLSRRFFMDAELNKNRPVGSLDKYLDEILSHLMNLPNVETSFRLVVEINIPDGVPEDTKEIVLGNCHDLKISNAHFEP